MERKCERYRDKEAVEERQNDREAMEKRQTAKIHSERGSRVICKQFECLAHAKMQNIYQKLERIKVSANYAFQMANTMGSAGTDATESQNG